MEDKPLEVSGLQKYARGEQRPFWYILTVARANDKTHTELERRVERFNRPSGKDSMPAGSGLQLFAPTYVEMRDRGNRVQRIRKPLACNYIFLRGYLDTLRRFRSLYADYNLIRDRARDGYLTVSDHDLDNFRRVANAYRNNMPCFRPDEVELQKGDRVRILQEGPFHGVEGVLVTSKGKDGGRVVISIANLLAVETVEISPAYIQVIEFAKGSKHIYDKLDSFEPRLRKAINILLKKRVLASGNDLGVIDKSVGRSEKIGLTGSASGIKLTLEESAPLDYFLRRFGKVTPESPKTAARLECLLMAAAALTGRTEEWRHHRTLFLKSLPSVTNPATRIRLLSLHALTTMLAIC